MTEDFIVQDPVSYEASDRSSLTPLPQGDALDKHTLKSRLIIR
jgi:hypothetical protein